MAITGVGMSRFLQKLQAWLGITPLDPPAKDDHLPLTTVTNLDGVLVVRFADLNATLGDRESSTVDRLEEELSSAIGTNLLAMVLDFENSEFVPSAAFEAALVRLHGRLDGRLSICNLPTTVAAHFEANRLTSLSPIHSDLYEAIAALQIPHLELPEGRRIPLIGDRLFISRIPFDEQRHENALGIKKDPARLEGDRLYLPDPHVSRRHAVLSRTEDDRYAIEDSGSSGGTFVNGESVTARTTLAVGDTLKLGETEIVYRERINLSPPYAADVFPWERFGSD
jgi:hypothetical protein